MLIRRFRPGDEAGQVRVYNAATAALPAYKPASTEEVARRYRGPAPTRRPGFTPSTATPTRSWPTACTTRTGG